MKKMKHTISSYVLLKWNQPTNQYTVTALVRNRNVVTLRKVIRSPTVVHCVTFLRAQLEVCTLEPLPGPGVSVVLMEDGLNQSVGGKEFVYLLTVVGADLERNKFSSYSKLLIKCMMGIWKNNVCEYYPFFKDK